MTLPLTLITASGSTRLAKRFTPTETIQYPNVRDVTSVHYSTERTAEGFAERFRLLRENARYGHAMLRGILKRPVVNESRRSLTEDPYANNFLLLDVDGWDTSGLGLNEWPLTPLHIERAAERFIGLMPEFLHDVSYIAHASSSFGMKTDRASLHIEFMLTEAIPTPLVKTWVTWLNLSIDAIRDEVRLSRNGHQLSWIVDPSVIDNSKLIYISTPTFEDVTDPFGDVSDNRWTLVTKAKPTVDLRSVVTHIERPKVNRAKTDHIRNLRKLAGLPNEAMRTRRILQHDPVTGETSKVSVIVNPAECHIELVRVTDEYAIFNINGGDSGAYWCKLAQPDVIYNFKGEEPFLFSQADPEAYDTFLATHTDQIQKVNQGEVVCFRNESDSTYYYGVYDPKNDCFPNNTLNRKQLFPVPRGNLEEAVASRGSVAPDVVPSVNMHFDPTTDVVWDRIGATINEFEAPPAMRHPVQIEDEFHGIAYDFENRGKNGISAYVLAVAPRIQRLIRHLIGDDDVCFEHFINWLAFCIQNRKISNTAWIFSGVPGTGKNLLMEQVLKPIWDQYATLKTQKNFEDSFNGGLDQLLMCAIDEVHLSESRISGTLLDTLKHIIGSPLTTIRAMRTEQREGKLHCNYLLFTNHLDAIRVEKGDRRFNIAPPQLVPLRDVHPDLAQEGDTWKIGEEAPRFASFLTGFKCDATAARTSLENQAKMDMRVASENSQDHFFGAVSEGSLDYFVDCVVSQSMDSVNNFAEISEMTAAKLITQTWLRDSHENRATFVPNEDLWRVYKVVFPHLKMPITKFSSLIRKYGFAPLRKTLSDGSKPRGYTIKWNLVEHADTPQVLALIHSNSTTHRAQMH